MVPDTARAAEELADTISLREMQFFRYGPCRVATYGGTAMCSGAYVYRNRPWKQSQSKLRLISLAESVVDETDLCCVQEKKWKAYCGKREVK
jgi:hypothetical protein